jgi:hypothetical protein
MATFLFLVGGLQGAYGQWGEVDGARRMPHHSCLLHGLISSRDLGHRGQRRCHAWRDRRQLLVRVLICDYYGTRYVISEICRVDDVGLMGLLPLVSWTYPAEIFPLRIRAKAVSLSTATNWMFNCVLGGSLLSEVVVSLRAASSSICRPSCALEHII